MWKAIQKYNGGFSVAITCVNGIGIPGVSVRAENLKKILISVLRSLHLPQR